MSFSSIVGQAEVKERLGHALAGSPGHAYIFTGPKGIGRTSLAREFAAALLCSQPGRDGACGSCPSCRYLAGGVHPDFRELELQEKEKVIPVDAVRQKIGTDLYHQPQLGPRKVYLIDADALNEQGQNALLKSLEEPPPYAIFLLTALSARHLLATIVSRAVVLMLSRLRADEVMAVMAAKDLHQHEAAAFFARFSGGVPGVALELAQSSWFHDLRQETIRFFMKLPESGRSNLLTDGFAFFEANRVHTGEILDVLGSLVRDLIVLSERSVGDLLINNDQRLALERLLPAGKQPATLRNHLTQAYRAVLAARRGLALNASFEGLACHLMLVLRKELTYA
jgi:DNA polymerase-3 subunit delta'